MAKRDTTGLPKRGRKKKQQEGEQAGSGNLLSNLLDSGDGSVNKQQETRLQQLVIGGIAVLVGLLVLFIVGGILWEQVLVPRQTVATVNGEDITISEFQERVRLERLIINQRFYNDIPFLVSNGIIQNPDQILQQEPYATYWSEITAQPELLGSRVLDDMINEQIIRQQAEELGVTVDEEAVDERIEQFFNFSPETDEAAAAGEEEAEATEEATEEPEPTATEVVYVSPTPSSTPTETPQPTPTPLPAEDEEDAEESESAVDVTPTVTPRPTLIPSATPSAEEIEENFSDTLDTFYQDASNEANLTRETVREYFRYQVLLQELRDTVTEDVSEEAPFVNARHILVETEEVAQMVLTALGEGESFADLARAVSTDTGSGSQGGELGWSPASSYVAPFRDAVLEAEVGTITEPVESEFGFHIIQVRAREDRELSERQFEQAKDTTFQEWFDEITNPDNNEIERQDNWPSHVPSQPQFNPARVVDDQGNPV